MSPFTSMLNVRVPTAMCSLIKYKGLKQLELLRSLWRGNILF